MQICTVWQLNKIVFCSAHNVKPSQRLYCDAACRMSDGKKKLSACLSFQPLHYRHHEPGHVIGPQPAASPQLPVNGGHVFKKCRRGACKNPAGAFPALRDTERVRLSSDQVGAVRQPRGAGERLPRPPPEEEADRDGDRQPDAQHGAGEDRRLDAAGLAPPQPLPGGAQLLRRHHR